MHHLHDAIPPPSSFQLVGRGEQPVLTIRPTFELTDGLLTSMLETVFDHPLAERTAVLCTNAWTAAKVATFDPHFIAFSFDEEGAGFYESAQTISPGATPVLLATMTAPTAPSWGFTSPGLAANTANNGIAAWRRDFPDALVVVRFVENWEQLLWTLDQGVDGVVSASNNALGLHEATLAWYRSNCALMAVLQHKLTGDIW
jgi:hypothetical protein